MKNPFDMPLQPKLDLLLQINDEALKVNGASFVSASMQFVNEQKYSLRRTVLTSNNR